MFLLGCVPAELALMYMIKESVTAYHIHSISLVKVSKWLLSYIGSLRYTTSYTASGKKAENRKEKDKENKEHSKENK